MSETSIMTQMRQMKIGDILGEVVADGEIAFACRNAERDNRAHWLAWLICEATDALIRNKAWYRGLPGCAVPSRLVSQIVCLGSDTSKNLKHRMMSLVRVSRVDNDVSTWSFCFLIVVMRTFLSHLEDCFEIREIGKLRALFFDFVAYCEEAKGKGHTQEQFTEILTKIATQFCDVWDRLCDRIADEEDALMKRMSCPPVERKVVETLERVAKDVSVIRNKAKTPPAGNRAQVWVVNKWKWYQQHPEACGSDKKKERVYVRDVWPMVKAEAEQYGITTLARFKRIKETAMAKERLGK